MSYLIPFQGKNTSANAKDNILYRHKNIYIMDNHRLALWCWFQEIKKDKKYNLFHIDAHPDMAITANDDFKTKNIDLWNYSLDSYRNEWQEQFNLPLFRWDNYIQIFLKHYSNLLAKEDTYSATHKVGSSDVLNHDFTSYKLLAEFNAIFSGKKYINENEWIVNIDLDYFFSGQPEKVLMFTTEYMEALALACNSGLQSGLISVLTIALSPECCGGWEKASDALKIFTKHLEISENILT